MAESTCKPIDFNKVGTPLANPKRERFCRYFVDDPETWGNASASWRKAGYAKRSSYAESFKALRKPEIHDRVRQLQVAVAEHEVIDADWMHTRLGWLSRYNVADVVKRISVWVEKDEGGEPLQEPHWEVDLDRIPRELSYCIEEVSYDAQGRPRIKMVSKKSALEMLGKLTKVKAFEPDQAISGDEDIAVLILKGRIKRGIDVDVDVKEEG